MIIEITDDGVIALERDDGLPLAPVVTHDGERLHITIHERLDVGLTDLREEISQP